ncbi:glucan phosphoethanolaminetransferase (alkaline phosphatase superfamily) [Paenibacillus sp. V4I9]|uniref:hypothetical protein n=1 Tax=Paenibacillus sp. V4I9 TaxID=3042308 RepID=UPI00278545CA|nr:hypothetical protein [Paenibacillus sp. V4I9]MDQ0888942.1 glucan phosphoethanolaminetransferase (alkaline phosphatase superfamily) [Paenibacillus sp. V4I9]
MTNFYNNLPSPIYLLISLVLGFFMLQYFLRNMKRYTVTLSIGMVFVSCTAILAGVVRIFHLLDIKWHIKLIEQLPLYGFVGLPLICIGAFLKTKDEPENREMALFGVSIFCLSFLLLAVVFLFFKK